MRKTLCAVITLLLLHTYVMAQSVITGKVTDARNGLPLSGVSVRLKSSSTGVQTDNDGVFHISLSGKEKTLIFSYVGFAPEELNIGSRTNLTIALTTEDRKLQEVVVVAYGSQEKRKVTGSIAKIDGKEFADVPMSSVDQMLQGKVAGLQSVASSGQPGAAQEIRIRGIGSINASSEPLFVIDGIPANTGDFSLNTTTTNALAGLNPNDIESISVLKDAAATSVYGSRAANGVILITTKKGKQGKTKIGVDAEYGNSKVAFINSQSKPLTKAQYTELTTEGLSNATGGDTATINFYLDALGANSGYNTDWFKQISRTGVTQQYNVSASGGDARTTFYVSGGYYKQQAVIIGSDFGRFSGNVNLRHKINDRVSLALTLNASHSDQNTPTQSAFFRTPVLAAYYLRPYQHPYNSDGTLDLSPDDFEQIFNPLGIVQYDRAKTQTNKVLTTISGEYNIVKGIKFTSKLGLDYFTLEEPSYENPFFGDAFGRGGDVTNSYTRVSNLVWTNTLDFHKELDKAGDLVADLKIGYESQKSKEYNITAFGSEVPLLTTLPLPPVSSPTTASGSGTDYSFVSGLSVLQLNYKNKYTISGSFRRDGSSRFGPNDRYGNFWSVGGAWNIDREAFLADSRIISGLKLRASYGVNGNANIGNYSWRSLYSFGADYNKLPGSAPANVGNPNLTWEQNKPFDVGLEIGILQNRVSLETDYYVRKTNQLLQSVPLSLTSGFVSYLDNIGSMENKGVEFTLNTTPVLGKKFRWDVSFNIAFNKNKVTALNDNADIINGTNIIRVGKDVQSIYTFLWAGVDPQTGNGLWYTDDTKKTKTDDVTQVQNAIVGSSSPKAFGGLSTSVSYAGLSLSAQFNYQWGNMLYNQWGFLNESDGAFFSLNQDQKEFNRRWKKVGDVTDVPQYVAGNTSHSNTTSTRYFYKGDYIRLRNITLTYQVPKNLTSHIKMDNIQVYVRGTNLWTHSFDKNITFDPEQPINGANDLQILMQKTISFGLNLNF